MSKAQDQKRQTIIDKIANLAKDGDTSGLRMIERFARQMAATITKEKNKSIGFKKGAMITFEHNGTKFDGIILRMGPRTATVATHDGGKWRVGYSIMKLVPEETGAKA